MNGSWPNLKLYHGACLEVLREAIKILPERPVSEPGKPENEEELRRSSEVTCRPNSSGCEGTGSIQNTELTCGWSLSQ
jgi:hypothetical protein